MYTVLQGLSDLVKNEICYCGSGNTRVSDQINYYISIIFKLILLPILAVIQEDHIVKTTRSHNNIFDLILVILNFSI